MVRSDRRRDTGRYTHQYLESRHPYLTERFNQMVLESQLPQNIFNLLFTITNQNNKLTVLLGS